VFDTSRASCIGINTELFFTESYYDAHLLPALKRLCAGCEVLKECRDYSLAHDLDGFWAGMAKTTRKKKQRELGIKPITLFKENYKKEERSA
jgi:hypothetical protein